MWQDLLIHLGFIGAGIWGILFRKKWIEFLIKFWGPEFMTPVKIKLVLIAYWVIGIIVIIVGIYGLWQIIRSIR